MFRLITVALFVLSVLFMTFQSANSQESILELLKLEDEAVQEDAEPVEELSAKERFNLSIEFAAKGKLKEASEEIGHALLVEPQNPIVKNIHGILTDVEDQTITKEAAVYLFKGLRFGKKSLFVKEAAYYAKALKLAPLYAPLFLFRGRSLQMAGNPTEAIENYTRAIDLEPLFAYAFYIRGLAYKKVELFELALEDYNRAIELEEGFAMAYNNRGFLHIVTFDNRAKGCADWLRACELGLCKNFEMARINFDCE